MVKKVILGFSVFFVSFFSAYATEPDTSSLGYCVWLNDISYGVSSSAFCVNSGTARLYNYDLSSNTIVNLNGLPGGIIIKTVHVGYNRHIVALVNDSGYMFLYEIHNASLEATGDFVYNNYGAPFYPASSYSNTDICFHYSNNINIAHNRTCFNFQSGNMVSSSNESGWIGEVYQLGPYSNSELSITTCTTRDMIRPFFRSYNYNGFYGIDSGSVVNDSVNGEYLVPYNMNNKVGEVWVGMKVTTQTGFIQSVYSGGTTSTQFASSLINVFEKPYLFFKKVKNLQYSGINYIFVSGSFPSDSYRLYDCSIDDADRSKPIYNLDTNDGTNVYGTETGHILNQFYEGLCLEFDSSWANYQYINSYQFGSMTLESQATTICQAPNGDYYDGSGTLLCSGSGCIPYNGTGTIDTGQTITPTEGSGFIDFGLIPGVAKIQSTGATCSPFTGLQFNYITTPGTMTITVNTGYKFINDWDFTVFGANLGKKLSDSINGFLLLIIEAFISFLNNVVNLIVNPLIQGLTQFQGGHYYCFFGDLTFMPNRIVTYYDGSSVGDLSNMDYFVFFILGFMILNLIFKKK